MALFHNSTEIGLRKTGVKVNVANDPKAKLMYYLDCICTVLKLDDQPEINRLRQYANYNSLSQSDTNLLVNICLLLKPDILLNKCIFQEDSLCGEFSNEFFNLETVSKNLLVADSVMIGGHQKKVTKIMAFKRSWLQTNWTNPMRILQERRDREQETCVIL